MMSWPRFRLEVPSGLAVDITETYDVIKDATCKPLLNHHWPSGISEQPL